MGKNISIPLKLNFTPNTLGCYGLKKEILNVPFYSSAMRCKAERNVMQKVLNSGARQPNLS